MDKKEGKFKDQPIAAKKKRRKKKVKETCFNPVLTAIASTCTIAAIFITFIVIWKDKEIKILEIEVKKQKEKLAKFIVDPDSRVPKIDPCQEYEWQWAGENWYGRIKLVKIKDGVEEDEKCKVEMARVFKIKKEFTDDKNFKITYEKELPILEQLRQGEFKFKKPDGLEIDLFVYKATTENSNYVVHKIKCDLKAVLCFAGKITYINSKTREAFEGDMVLVNYQSLEGEETKANFPPTRDFLSLIKKEVQL